MARMLRHLLIKRQSENFISIYINDGEKITPKSHYRCSGGVGATQRWCKMTFVSVKSNYFISVFVGPHTSWSLVRARWRSQAQHLRAWK